jgi:hypothetical protein
MAFQIRYMMYVDYLAPGAQSLGAVPAQQSLLLGQVALQGIGLATAPGGPAGEQQVPGGESPTQANFNNALTGSNSTPTGGMALDLANAIAANLGRIQAFSSGGS